MEKRRSLKKTKFGHSVLRKPKFKMENNHFEKFHNAENCKRKEPLGFLEIQSVAKYRES